MKNHIAYIDRQGEYYCRAVHAVMSDKKDQMICGIGCPCFQGKTKEGYPICRYNSACVADDTITPDKLYQMVQQEIEDGREPLFPITDGDSPEVLRAYDFAAKAHAKQRRKGTQLPYLTHIITTMKYAKLLTDDTEVLIAAALHDTVEDTWVTLEMVCKEFGDRVAWYLEAETENKRTSLPASDTWELRKQENIKHIHQATTDVKMIFLADKAANAESLVRELHQDGEILWTKFNQKDKKKHAWYYRECANALWEFADTEVYRLLREYIQVLFQGI
ncbi:MAG: bifunctional (p)ppGpp synthetase/guanosine-3',5'-bis(diphosphate) 3'-pyrophosphohydrolase [Lachnospiraceae bacterium]|nr:bifunctional (p)ppGpp synthetase/guanosine-3',5'-bis(diphosphate) 3'-pyrophosphohydrolase [Lachnospiraceae bacterium]